MTKKKSITREGESIEGGTETVAGTGCLPWRGSRLFRGMSLSARREMPGVYNNGEKMNYTLLIFVGICYNRNKDRQDAAFADTAAEKINWRKEV